MNINMNEPLMSSMKADSVRVAAELTERLAGDYREDADLRARMEQDAVAALADYGVTLVPGTEVRLVEDSPDTFHFTLPPDPNVNLKDEQLDMVAGGKSGVYMGEETLDEHMAHYRRNRPSSWQCGA